MAFGVAALSANAMLVAMFRPPTLKTREETDWSKTSVPERVVIELRESASELASTSVPAETDVAPVKVFAAERVSVPRPAFVKAPLTPLRELPAPVALPMLPASVTLFPLVSKVSVPDAIVMPPVIAPRPLVMSVVAPVAQRIVPPLEMRPPGLSPKLVLTVPGRTVKAPVEANSRPPVKVLAPVRVT